MNPKHVKKHCRLDATGENLPAEATPRLRLTDCACHRILKLVRTFPDLERSEAIAVHHLLEAIRYRALDRGAP
jgi:magnesium chelatase family protein